MTYALREKRNPLQVADVQISPVQRDGEQGPGPK